MRKSPLDFSRYHQRLEQLNTMTSTGRVSEVAGLVIESIGPSALIGEICEIHTGRGQPVKAEVVGFRDNRVLLMPIGPLEGISMGNRVVASGHPLTIRVGPGLLGRILGGTGDPIDGKGPLQSVDEVRSVYSLAPDPLRRERIREPLGSGIRAIDGFITLGKGQRVGIFSGSGVGKSTLLGEIAKYSEAEVAVIGLIGERGREVREFIEECLGPQGLARSVVVVVTSDLPALVRIKGALVATSVAEYFRDQGKDVVLMMDSITRYCNAQREVGLSIGEPPTTRGYPPSAFAILPKLLERAGRSEKGSITGLYTVLVDGDDLQEPVSDACRAILDGHIVLSRRLADRNHYPAIDPLTSVSRIMKDVVPKEHLESARKLTALYAIYRDAEDLISIGAYNRGADPKIDEAIEMYEPINNYLRQEIGETGTFEEHSKQLVQLAGLKPTKDNAQGDTARREVQRGQAPVAGQGVLPPVQQAGPGTPPQPQPTVNVPPPVPRG